MKRTYCLRAASLLALGAAVSANAASRDEQVKACRGDALHFCAIHIPNEAKITACMVRHMNKLSPACRAMFKHDEKDDDVDKAASQ